MESLSVTMVNQLEERWLITEKLGEGTYAKVYLGQPSPAALGSFPFPSCVAIKRYKETCIEDEGLSETLVRELALMSLMRQHPHPNLLMLYEVCYSAARRQVVNAILEYMPCTLESVLDAEEVPHSWSCVQPMLIQMLSALEHLHSLQIVHRDLSVGNVFLDGPDLVTAHVKIGDFNLSKIVSPNMTPGLVTLNYRAPEMLCETHQYSTAIDLWSCGCIAAEVLRGSILFDGRGEMDILALILATIGAPDNRLAQRMGLNLRHIQRQMDREKSFLRGRTLVDRLYTNDPMAIHVCTGLLRLDPDRRLTATQALELLQE